MEKRIISFDYAIKNILRDKANFDILSGFLSELLGKEVSVLEILESESNKDRKNDKLNRLDLKAKITGGEIVIFEVQVEREYDFFLRLLYGTSRAVSEQIGESDDYEKIKKVYSVAIVYFELGKGSDYIYHGTTDFKGVHSGETLLLSEKEEKVIHERRAGDLFPEYYLIYPAKFDEIMRSKFDEWVYALKNSVVKSEFTAAGIQSAQKKLNVLQMTDEERWAYNDFVKARRVQSNELKSSYSDGLIDGEAKGREEGEKNKALEVAKKMKTRGLTAEEISEMTGLSVGEIEKL